MKDKTTLEIKRKISKYEGRLEALQEFMQDNLITDNNLMSFTIKALEDLIECLEYILTIKECDE